MKPIVGINLDITAGPPEEARVQSFYFQSVQKAGGIPVLIPPMANADLSAILSRLDGLLLIGGLDYCPSTYGETVSDEEKRDLNIEVIHEMRQDFDFRLVKLAIETTSLPVLGICGGCQLINVALGGTLIKDIDCEIEGSTVKHASPNGWQDGFKRHEVRIEAGSALRSIYKAERIDVPTSHHQAVKEPGRGLRATAFADDGVIEAVEMEGRTFVVGVQWHPERDFKGNKRLFDEFIANCAHVIVKN